MILKLIHLLNLINFTEKCGNIWKKNHSTGSLLNVTTLNGSQLLYTQQHNIYSSLVHWPTLRHELSKRHTHQRSLSHMHLICIYAMRASGKTQTSSRFSISTQFQIHQLRWHSTSCHRLCNSQTSATFKWIFLVSSILVFVNWTQFKLSSTVFYVTFIYFFCVNFIYFRVLCAVIYCNDQWWQPPMPKVTFASSLKLGRSLNGKKVRVYRLSGESTTTPSNVSIHCFPMSDIRLVSSLAMKNDIFLVFFLNLGYKHGSFESNQKKRKRASDIKRLWHYYSLLSVKKSWKMALHCSYHIVDSYVSIHDSSGQCIFQCDRLWHCNYNNVCLSKLCLSNSPFGQKRNCSHFECDCKLI